MNKINIWHGYVSGNIVLYAGFHYDFLNFFFYFLIACVQHYSLLWQIFCLVGRGAARSLTG